MADGSYHVGATTSFPKGLRVEPATVTLRGGVKLQAVSLPSGPPPLARYKARTTERPCLGSRRKAGARALHYDDDYNDYSQRENENKEKTGGPGDYNDKSHFYNGMSSYV